MSIKKVIGTFGNCKEIPYSSKVREALRLHENNVLETGELIERLKIEFA